MEAITQERELYKDNITNIKEKLSGITKELEKSQTIIFETENSTTKMEMEIKKVILYGI